MKFFKSEKSERKRFKALLKTKNGCLARSFDGKITVAVIPDGSGFHFGIATCSDNDKQKRKYGEWLALNRALFYKAFFPAIGADGKPIFAGAADFADYLLMPYNETRF